MNSLDIAFQMRHISLDSCCDGISSPPHQLDCSGFDKLNCMTSLNSCETASSQHETSSSASFTKGWGRALSRSQCVTNLSSLGRAASEETMVPRSLYKPNKCEHSAPKDEAGSWGYFVDSVK
ncbi:hypothetical protein HJC23_009670 [Cyclotella cryptica]|uniref:Uncharacterized protein n=1 Tax=Cyclotella cryptica TaxID=29204 RepID=A0ABD3NJD2_9STRA